MSYLHIERGVWGVNSEGEISALSRHRVDVPASLAPSDSTAVEFCTHILSDGHWLMEMRQDRM